MSLDQVFEDFLPVDVSLNQIPDRVRLNDRTIAISGSEIRSDSDESIVAVLFTITDATSLETAEETVKNNEMLLNILKDKDSFMMFLDDFYHEISLALEAAENNDSARVRALLHTVKGNLGAFGISNTASLVHEIESQQEITIEDIKCIQESLDSLLTQNRSILSIDMGHLTDTNSISQQEVDELLSYIDRNVQGQPSDVLSLKISNLMAKPVRSYLGPIEKNVLELAGRLGKKIEFHIKGEHLKLDIAFSHVLHSLIHVVRNSVDHGIEMPDQRYGKPATGKISMDFQIHSEGVTVRLADDGQGLNRSRILEKALSIGIT